MVTNKCGVAWAGIVCFVGGAMLAAAQQVAAPQAQPGGGKTNAPTTIATNLPDVIVTATALHALREQIVPSLGATEYTLNREQIASQSQGDNAPFDQTFYRFPGVAQDELDKRLHVRGEEANLQYRINDVLLPDGLLGFGQELSTKFVDKLSLITGTLPAQYGGRTAGIVDIQTKNGADQEGTTVSCYGGSYNTINPSVEYSGASGRETSYFEGSYLHSSLGMANPTASLRPIHDDTDQYKAFADVSYLLDNTSQLSLILSGEHSDFQIPNRPGQVVNDPYGGITAFDSTKLDETQMEQSYYELLTFLKKVDDLSLQLSQFTRYAEVSFTPDEVGDLLFNGVASRVDHTLVSNGLLGDASDRLNDWHTLRGGFSFTAEKTTVQSANLVLPATWDPVAGQWVPTPGGLPFNIDDNSSKMGYMEALYLQDEWKVLEDLTLNYGLRFDQLNAYVNENQLSPRINAVVQLTDQTTLHAGFGSYFTPPPLYLVQAEDTSKFDKTTHGVDPGSESPAVKAERYNYFDAGVIQQFGSEFRVGLDGYYKRKRDVLDEGQFGPAMIFSPNNAALGRVYGAELTLNYEHKGFSAYANLALSRAIAKGIVSGQFQFSPDELAYMQEHWYHLDHDQDITGSAGSSYQWGNLRVYADALYGSGLYGGPNNTEESPQYITFNTGMEYTLKPIGWGVWKLRFDVVNLLDRVYEIRDGDGIGVFAPQYLPRRGFYGGASCAF